VNRGSRAVEVAIAAEAAGRRKGALPSLAAEDGCENALRPNRARRLEDWMPAPMAWRGRLPARTETAWPWTAFDTFECAPRRRDSEEPGYTDQVGDWIYIHE
jgi:hypothetical protein